MGVLQVLYEYNAGLNAETDKMKRAYSSAQLVYVIVVLTLASTFSIIDRQILNVMIGPVQRDHGGISDFQMSLIMGFAFTFLFSILSYPAGWIADRYSRKNLMAAGILSWSILTMLCGTASQYWHLFLARMGVGVGQHRRWSAHRLLRSRTQVCAAVVRRTLFLADGFSSLPSPPIFVWRRKAGRCFPG